jgi:hypothetical protein
MGVVLKIVATIYLAIIWGTVVRVFYIPYVPNIYFTELGLQIFLIVFAISSSVPAAALFGFGQVVGDVRAMRGHLKAMRKYYEPNDKFDGM